MTDDLNNTQRLAKRISFVAVILIAALMSLIMFWLFTGNDVLDVKNNPVPVKPSFVKSTENVVLDVSFCKKTNSTGRVTRRLVSDKSELLAPTDTDNSGKGCHDHAPIVVPIPAETVPGVYHVNYRVVYTVNPLKTVIEEFNSQNFTVTE